MHEIGYRSCQPRLLLIVALLCLSACSEKPADNAAATNRPSPAMTDPADTGKVSLPDNFPSDIPVYPGLVITGANADQGQGIFNVQGRTGDTLAQVKDFLSGATTTRGWELVNEADAGGMMYSFQFRKGERQLAYMLMQNDGTSVSVNVRKLHP